MKLHVFLCRSNLRDEILSRVFRKDLRQVLLTYSGQPVGRGRRRGGRDPQVAPGRPLVAAHGALRLQPRPHSKGILQFISERFADKSGGKFASKFVGKFAYSKRAV